MTYWYPGVVEAVRSIRSIYPKVPLVMGGIYASLCTAHCRTATQADFVNQGPAVPGLTAVLKELDLPVPPGTLKSTYLPDPAHPGNAVVVRFNEGCPCRCSYCASPFLCSGFLPGDPDQFYDYLLEIHGSTKMRNIAFYDDALLAGKEKGLIPLITRIAEARMDFRFYLPNGVHIREIDPECAGALKKSGFREVRLGFESARSDFHAAYGNKLEIDMLGEAVEALMSAGFGPQDVGVYLLAGLPGQTRDEVEESIRFVSRFNVRIRLAEYSPTPHSGLWEESVRKSRYPLAEEPLTHNNSVVPLAWKRFTRMDLERLKKLAGSCSPAS